MNTFILHTNQTTLNQIPSSNVCPFFSQHWKTVDEQQHMHGAVIIIQRMCNALCTGLPLPEVSDKGMKHLLVRSPF